jgi:predicted metalloprotease with PDZ domain
MQDIPYKHYSFLGIGPGNGGIEHLTSSANSFTGAEMKNKNGRKAMLSFLAHEYFHNYNVKRVRPIELGPFDYEHGSKTDQLWISEGWTVYYEYLLLSRAGILSAEDLYKNFQRNILAYEKYNGRHVQSLSQSSSETWNDGPFGNDKDKTISYYDKGPVVALMLDFAIRHQTNNSKSLDDVMRLLYQKFYKEKQRGFTENEFWQVCESVAGTSLKAFYDYVHSTQELDYGKYFAYAGLKIDTQNRTFKIEPMTNAGASEQQILQSWISGSKR